MVDGPSKMLQFWFPGTLSALNGRIPADARLLEGDPLQIDQSALTGESLPITKNPSDEVFSGLTCKKGEIEAVVIATGVHTFFGKAAHLVDNTNQVGHFQKVLTAIGNFCICSIAVGIAIEIIVLYPIQHRKYRDGIDNLLVLLIGGIPIAMPTVLSVTRGLLIPTLTLMATGIEQAKVHLSRYTAVYLLLFSATLVKYFATSGSSPGYVLDAMRALNESNALRKSSTISKGIPERVFPFSKGVRQNIYNFCCGQTNLYNLERLPTALEIEEKLRPYTCLDFLTCHCC